MGCFVASSSSSSLSDPRQNPSFWLPPSYEPIGDAQHPRVIDPTGAGNAFLEAFCIGLVETGSLYRAACYGTVGASLALEQVGVPNLSVDEWGRERGNGEDVFERLQAYEGRIKGKEGGE